MMMCRASALRKTFQCRQFSFPRLTKHYPERQAMALALEEVQRVKTMKARAIHTKLTDFLWRIKGRIIFVSAISASFYYWGNYLAWVPDSLAKEYAKYKRRWIARYNPTAVEYVTAFDTSYLPEKLTPDSITRLSSIFCKTDRELEHGFSRQLIIDVLKEMGCMTE